MPYAVRLHRPAEFVAALKGRRIARGQWLAIHVPQSAASSTPCARLGLVIAKRLAKRAVTRNAIKRVLREAFRHVRHDLPPRDFVFRLVSPVAPYSLTALKRQMREEANLLLVQANKRLASSDNGVQR